MASGPQGDVNNQEAWIATTPTLGVGAHGTPAKQGDIPNPDTWNAGGASLAFSPLLTEAGVIIDLENTEYLLV